MKKLFCLCLVLILCLFGSFAFATNSTTDSHDNSYTIDLGEGNGSLLIIGDGNTVYLPEKTEPEDTMPDFVNEFQGNTKTLILGPTEAIGPNGTVIYFSKIVLQWQPNGTVSVVYTEQ